MIAAATNRKRLATPLWLAAAWLVVVGAVPPSALMKRGDYADAAAGYREVEAQRPHDASVKRNLGIVLLKRGQAADAVAKLQEARALAPRDAPTLFFLGEAAAQAGQPDVAEEAYRHYLAVAGQSKRANAVRARVQALSLAGMKSWAQERIQREQGLRADSLATNTIAVPQFIVPENADTLRPLSRGLAVVMTTDLSQVPGLRVVERERLRELLDELERAEPRPYVGEPPGPSEFRRDDAPRVGRLLAVRRFAQGGLDPIDHTQVQVDAALIDVSNAAIVSAGPPLGGPLVDVLKLEKFLVFQILGTLGISVPGPLQAKIARLPTQSFGAFLEFSRGVDYEERGHRDEAIAAYRKAASLDPSFAMPRAREELLTVTPADGMALDAALFRAAADEGVTEDRLLRSGSELAMGPGPFRTRHTATDPTIVSATKAGGVEIKVSGRLP